MDKSGITRRLASLVGAISLMLVVLPLGVARANHPVTSCLNVTPESVINPTLPAGQSHTLTATLRLPGPPSMADPSSCTGAENPATPGGGPVKISYEITGPHDPEPSSNSPDTPDGQCLIPEGQSSCNFAITDATGMGVGTDTVRVWIDHDGQSAEQGGMTEADLTETRNEAPPGQGSKPEPDDTDVVEKVWRNILECTPETREDLVRREHELTCTASDADTNGLQLIPGAFVDVEVAGANDPDGSDSPGTPDLTCTTQQDGTCFVVLGDNESDDAVGKTTFRAWIDLDGDHASNQNGQVEADLGEGQLESGTGSTPGTKTEPDDTDVMTRDWNALLDCTPETANNQVGTSHTISCRASDENNSAVANVRVDAEARGTNDPDPTSAGNPTGRPTGDSQNTPDFFCTTDLQGSCTFTHGPAGTGSSANSGTTTYRAWVDMDGNHSTTPPTHGFSEADQAEVLADESAANQDDTDDVEKVWSPGPLDLDCDDESGDDHQTNPNDASPESSETYTCTVRNQAGGIDEDQRTINAELDRPLVNGNIVNDPDNPDAASYANPDYTCTTEDPDLSLEDLGTCQITVTQAEAETGTVEICFWESSEDPVQ